MKSSIDISPRKKQLKEKYEQLQLEYAALVAERDELEISEGPRKDLYGEIKRNII